MKEVRIMAEKRVGFVLVTSSPNYCVSVFEKIKKLEETVEAHHVIGEQDIIVKIQVDNLEFLGNVVLNKIRNIEGVLDIKTICVLKSYYK
jgi:DNA-binding Lrp family transcriptional regulator